MRDFNYTLTDEFNYRFWAKVRITPGCWIWIAAKKDGDGGYGVIGVPGTKQIERASRIMLFWKTGEVPPGRDALHVCDYPPCIHPDHLYWGTEKENAADMLLRKRHNPCRGESNGHAHLRESDVRELRRLRETENIPYRKLGEMFGISNVTARHIAIRKKWAGVI